jgi:hypothetical protein
MADMGVAVADAGFELSAADGEGGALIDASYGGWWLDQHGPIAYELWEPIGGSYEQLHVDPDLTLEATRPWGSPTPTAASSRRCEPTTPTTSSAR